MSCSTSRVVFDDPIYTDKLEDIRIEIPVVNGFPALPANGYTVQINGQEFVSSATQEDGFILLVAVIPANTLAEGTYRDGIVYPNTDIGSQYFEIELTITLEDSRSI